MAHWVLTGTCYQTQADASARTNAVEIDGGLTEDVCKVMFPGKIWIPRQPDPELKLPHFNSNYAAWRRQLSVS